jgi:hypothetical protein
MLSLLIKTTYRGASESLQCDARTAKQVLRKVWEQQRNDGVHISVVWCVSGWLKETGAYAFKLVLGAEQEVEGIPYVYCLFDY